MSHFVLFGFTDADRWRPGIGDPTFMGWFTVFGYFLAMMLAWKAASTSRSEMREKFALSSRSFWWGITALLLFLGINKQLDLQTWLTLTVKSVAKSQGWYEGRRVVQVLFIGAIGVGALVVCGGLLWAVRKRLREFGVAIVGVIFLCAFILVRAASFHHVDQLLLAEIGGMRMNWIFELTGIAVIAVAAALAWRRNVSSRAAPSTGFIWVTANDRL